MSVITVCGGGGGGDKKSGIWKNYNNAAAHWKPATQTIVV